MRKKTTVVIADDNDMMRSILRAMLRGDAYEVVGEARNGTQAVEIVTRLKPQIVCLDVMMPEKDGLEALQEINDALPDTTVVMITANADPDTVQMSIMSGAKGYIVKPFNAARVLDTLGKFRAHKRA